MADVSLHLITPFWKFLLGFFCTPFPFPFNLLSNPIGHLLTCLAFWPTLWVGRTWIVFRVKMANGNSTNSNCFQLLRECVCMCVRAEPQCPVLLKYHKASPDGLRVALIWFKLGHQTEQTETTSSYWNDIFIEYKEAKFVFGNLRFVLLYFIRTISIIFLNCLASSCAITFNVCPNKLKIPFGRQRLFILSFSYFY